MPNFCAKCGSPMNQHTGVCNNCGWAPPNRTGGAPQDMRYALPPVQNVPRYVQARPTRPAYPLAEPAPAKAGGRVIKGLLIGIIVMLVLVCGIVSVLLLTGGSNDMEGPVVVEVSEDSATLEAADASEIPAEAATSAEEVPVEEAPVEEAPVEEAPVEEATTEFVWNGQMEVWSILPTTSAEGLIWISDAMGAIMTAEGFTYVKKDAEGNPANQVSFVEDAIAAGNVGALMIAAMSVDKLQDVVVQALEAGIAVAYLGSEPTNYSISGCVYSAYEITGMWAVQAAEDWVRNRVAAGGNVPTNADGRYEVACDVYTKITDGIYRSNGMVGTVDASEILTRVSTTTSYSGGYTTAYDNAQEILSAHPNCHIFIAYESDLALGINDAIVEYCRRKGLNLADYCVISCYGDDSTFASASAVKGYSTYGDPAMPYGDETAAAVGNSYAAMEAYARGLSPNAIIPPVLTGEHLADILLSACRIVGFEFEPGYGNTYYDTVTVCNVYGYADTWTYEMENPAAAYKIGHFIG